MFVFGVLLATAAVMLLYKPARYLSAWLALWLPFVLLYVIGGEFYLRNEISENIGSAQAMRFACLFTPLALLFGAIAFDWLAPAQLGARHWKIPEFLPRTAVHPTAQLVLMVLGLVVLSFNLYYVVTNRGALTAFISAPGEKSLMMEAREAVAERDTYWFALIRGAFGPFVAIYFTIDYLDRPDRKKEAWRLLFPAVELLARFARLHRSPMFFLLAMLIVVVRRRTKLSFASAFTAVMLLAGIFVGVVFYTAYRDGQDLSYGFEDTWIRVVRDPNFGLWNYFEVFPTIAPHTNGGNIRLVNALFYDGRVIPAMTYIPLVVYGVRGTSWNAVFIADLWADFGWAGIAVGALAVGAFSRGIDVGYTRRLDDRPFQAMWLASVFGQVGALYNGYLPCLLSTGGIGLMIILANFIPRSQAARGVSAEDERRRRSAAPTATKVAAIHDESPGGAERRPQSQPPPE